MGFTTVLARAAAVIVIAVVATLGVPAAAGACLVGCSVTTSAPTASSVEVTASTLHSVRLSGTVSSGGLQTQWEFVGDDNSEDGQGVANASSSPTQVTSDLAVIPGQRYDVHLHAANADGSTDGPTTSFLAAQEPPLPVTLKTPTRQADFASGFALHARIDGSPDNDVVEVLGEPAGSHRYRPVTRENATGRSVVLDVYPARNTRYRARLTGQNWSLPDSDRPTRQASPTSAAMTVYVQPHIVVTMQYLPGPGEREQAVFGAEVHRISSHFVGERVYFYRSTHARGPYVLFGSARVHALVTGGALFQLVAAVPLPPASNYHLRACVRSRLLPDMGRPFHDTACGRRRLA